MPTGPRGIITAAVRFGYPWPMSQDVSMAGTSKHSIDEHVAASAVASLSRALKRGRDGGSPGEEEAVVKKAPKLRRKVRKAMSDPDDETEDTPAQGRELRQAPFFYYINFSQMEDDDPPHAPDPSG